MLPLHHCTCHGSLQGCVRPPLTPPPRLLKKKRTKDKNTTTDRFHFIVGILLVPTDKTRTDSGKKLAPPWKSTRQIMPDPSFASAGVRLAGILSGPPFCFIYFCRRGRPKTASTPAAVAPAAAGAPGARGARKTIHENIASFINSFIDRLIVPLET